MEKEKIGVTDRIKMKGLKNMGLIEISQDTKTGEFVLVMARGIEKKGLIFNVPKEMWRVRCKKEEVPGVVRDFVAQIS